jgi:hypothetical protein
MTQAFYADYQMGRGFPQGLLGISEDLYRGAYTPVPGLSVSPERPKTEQSTYTVSNMTEEQLHHVVRTEPNFELTR